MSVSRAGVEPQGAQSGVFVRGKGGCSAGSRRKRRKRERAKGRKWRSEIGYALNSTGGSRGGVPVAAERAATTPVRLFHEARHSFAAVFRFTWARRGRGRGEREGGPTQRVHAERAAHLDSGNSDGTGREQNSFALRVEQGEDCRTQAAAPPPPPRKAGGVEVGKGKRRRTPLELPPFTVVR